MMKTSPVDLSNIEEATLDDSSSHDVIKMMPDSEAASSVKGNREDCFPDSIHQRSTRKSKVFLQESQRQSESEPSSRLKENGGRELITRKTKTEALRRNRKIGSSDESSALSLSSSGFSTSSGEEDQPAPRRHLPSRTKRKLPETKSESLSPSRDVPTRGAKRRRMLTSDSSAVAVKGAANLSRAKGPSNSAQRDRSSSRLQTPTSQYSYSHRSHLEDSDLCDLSVPLSASTLVVASTYLELQSRRQIAIESYLDAVENFFFPPVVGGFDELFYTWITATCTKKKYPKYCERFSEEQRRLRVESFRNHGEMKKRKLAQAAERLRQRPFFHDNEQLTYLASFSTADEPSPIHGIKTEVGEDTGGEGSNIKIDERNKRAFQESVSPNDASRYKNRNGTGQNNHNLPSVKNPVGGPKPSSFLSRDVLTRSRSDLENDCDAVDAHQDYFTNIMNESNVGWLDEWVMQDKSSRVNGQEGSIQQSQYQKILKLTVTNGSMANCQISWLDFLKSPVIHMPPILNWSPREIAIFEVGLCTYGQNFGIISQYISTKSYKETFEFYAEIFKQVSHV